MSPEREEIAEEDMAVTDNADESRYELRIGGELAAFVTYKRSPGRIVLVHTETLDKFEGKGAAGHLVRAALDEAREQGLHVVPRCPFVARYVDEHPEYQDLVA